MGAETDSKAFDDLRILAHRLDIRFGTERRKLILVGHERLTLATNDQDWADFRSGVESRLKAVTADESIVRQLLWPK